MKQDVTPTKTHLPANFAERLSAGIAEARANTIINAGGKPLLRLLKDGDWVFGQGNEAVQEGSRWVINVASIGHGYCCWIDGALRGEVMSSVFDHKPAQPAPVEGTSFKEQRSFDMKCIDGDDAGTEVLYKTSSLSGMSESDRLFATLQARVADEQVYIFPVVQLEVSSYPHKKHGKIYTPVLTVVGWVDQNGEFAGGGETGRVSSVYDEMGQRKPGRPRKAPIGATAEPTEEPPLTTQQAHATGQPVRRRPGR